LRAGCQGGRWRQSLWEDGGHEGRGLRDLLLAEVDPSLERTSTVRKRQKKNTREKRFRGKLGCLLFKKVSRTPHSEKEWQGGKKNRREGTKAHDVGGEEKSLLSVGLLYERRKSLTKMQRIEVET